MSKARKKKNLTDVCIQNLPHKISENKFSHGNLSITLIFYDNLIALIAILIYNYFSFFFTFLYGEMKKPKQNLLKKFTTTITATVANNIMQDKQKRELTLFA